VPAGYITHQYSDRLWVGFAVNAHFGLETDYDANWVGRYHAIKSELLTLDFNPSLAFKVNDSATVALGISALYADGKLTNAIDGGLLDTLAGGGNIIPDVTIPPGGFDLNAELKGDDWGFGFNFGILLEPSDNTRLGLHYRSKIELDLEGTSTTTGPSGFPTSAQGGKLPLTLPGSLSVSGYHALNSQWAVMADLTWTEWSKIQNLNITLADGRKNNNAWKYDDSTRIAIGTEYRHSPEWIFRTGLALDKTPVPSDADRSPRVPDADRTWLTFGATHQYSKAVKVDFAYAHLFVDDPKLDGVSDGNDPTLDFPAGITGFHSLSGSYDASVDIIGVQLNWKWK
jgi:long-chain fatty acid transport protein